MAVDTEVEAVELAVSGDIGRWLALKAAFQESVQGFLIGGADLFIGVGEKPGAAEPQYVSQENFTLQRRIVDIFIRQSLAVVSQTLPVPRVVRPARRR
jgi:hypothetical protein